MPTIGDIKYGRELGVKDRKHKYIWISCPNCDKERWVAYRGANYHYTFRCHPCAMKRMRHEGHPGWRGGRVNHTEGYRAIKVAIDDFFYPMANHVGYVAEHRLVMAKHLNRHLLPWEIVHHKNGTRNDNRLENLELLPGRKYHIGDTLTKSLLKTMKKKIDYLESLLKAHNIKFS